jgi:uncharacterized protein YciI
MQDVVLQVAERVRELQAAGVCVEVKSRHPSPKRKTERADWSGVPHPSRPLEEQSDWSAHASFMDGLEDAGFVVLGGPFADGQRPVLVVEAESEEAVRATLARDPWSETHLQIDTIDSWTIRLDGRRA